jgi:predicted RNase H-like HicB family nuclease
MDKRYIKETNITNNCGSSPRRNKNMKLNLTAEIWEGDQAYISKCPELGISSCGATPEEALDNLEEAAWLYLDDAESRGIMADVENAIASPHKFASMIELVR